MSAIDERPDGGGCGALLLAGMVLLAGGGLLFDLLDYLAARP